MNDIKLLATDLDGTLLLDDHLTVTDRTKQALRLLKEQGTLLCISTGRLGSMLPEAAADIGFDYIITSNGASCYDVHAQKYLFKVNIDADKARLVYHALEPYDCLTQWFVNDELLMDQRNYRQIPERLHAPWHLSYLAAGRGTFVEDINTFFDAGAPGLEKVNVMHFPAECYNEIIAPLRQSGSLDISTSLGSNFEVTDRNATKGNALKRLCGLLGLELSQTIAFGDSSNDLSMLRTAGLGVTMGNATKATLAEARILTLSNEQDGLADYLEKHLLR